MNEVITKLDEIENKAGALLADAASRKDQLMLQLEQDKRELDVQYEKKEQESTGKRKAERRAEAAGRIAQLEKENQEAIHRLDDLYESRGEELAETIFHRIIKDM